MLSSVVHRDDHLGAAGWMAGTSAGRHQRVTNTWTTDQAWHVCWIPHAFLAAISQLNGTSLMLQAKGKAKKKKAAVHSDDEDDAMSMSDDSGDSDFDTAPKKVRACARAPSLHAYVPLHSQ